MPMGRRRGDWNRVVWRALRALGMLFCGAMLLALLALALLW